MARTRFVPDTGLTLRMTSVMFLLGGLFVALIVGLMFAVNSPGLSIVIGLAGIGIAWYQWYRSDTLALRAMRAREVTAEEAPELHAMIERLCIQADLPKPKVAVAYTDMPNAFALGKSQKSATVCATTGIISIRRSLPGRM